MIPKVVASEIGTAQTLTQPYGLTARVVKGVAKLDNFQVKPFYMDGLTWKLTALTEQVMLQPQIVAEAPGMVCHRG